MTAPHRIRFAALGRATPRPARFAGCGDFGRPTNVQPDEAVWLVVAGLPGPAALTLNGRPLGTAQPGVAALDITRLLARRNELHIELEDTQPPPTTGIRRPTWRWKSARPRPGAAGARAF